MDNANSIVTYKDLSEIASDLCRTISDDQLLCKSTYTKLHEWIGKVRSGQRFNVVFDNADFPTEASDKRNGDPIATIVTPAGGGSQRKKSYKSSQEISRTKYHNTPYKNREYSSCLLKKILLINEVW